MIIKISKKLEYDAMTLYFEMIVTQTGNIMKSIDEDNHKTYQVTMKQINRLFVKSRFSIVFL